MSDCCNKTVIPRNPCTTPGCKQLIDSHCVVNEDALNCLGLPAESRLDTILSTLCNNLTSCCPFLNYTLSAEFDGCVNGEPTYVLTGTTITSITSPVGFTIYTAVSPFTNYTNGGQVARISVTAGASEFGVLAFPEDTEVRVLLIDSRGNWSNVLVINTEAC